MFMFFVDGETNKVGIRKLLQELEHLQEQIKIRDVCGNMKMQVLEK